MSSSGSQLTYKFIFRQINQIVLRITGSEVREIIYDRTLNMLPKTRLARHIQSVHTKSHEFVQGELESEQGELVSEQGELTSYQGELSSYPGEPAFGQGEQAHYRGELAFGRYKPIWLKARVE